jgi:hypothetical protein
MLLRAADTTGRILNTDHLRQAARLTACRCSIPGDIEEVRPMEATGDRHVILQDGGQAFDQLRGKARYGEPDQAKPFREWVAGDELHRATGQRRHVERVIDREHDRYWERIRDEAGDVVREVDEPLRDHRGHGAATRADGPQPGAEE